MNATNSLFTVALATIATIGCSPAPAADVVNNADATASDTITATEAQDAPAADGDVSSCALPAGFTLTPYLSTEQETVFTQADMVLEPQRDYVAVIETDAGRIVLDLFETETPITVNSFVFLARHHYFEGIAFHRVLDGFVAQGGDPNTLTSLRSSWGSGGPGYGFGLEIVSSLRYDMAGVVGMARTADPNSNGSQFFITLAPTPSLDGMYTIFARVSEGLDVLPLLARNQSSMVPPAVPTRMTRVCIAERAR